jgi:hypothetical protein
VYSLYYTAYTTVKDKPLLYDPTQTIPMRSQQPRRKRISTCIFCPSPPDTKEHAWEKWALRRVHAPDDQIVLHGHVEGDAVFVPSQKAIRIKCLCRLCNEGWLKGVIDAAIPLASPMLNDIALPIIDIPQQRALSAWALSRAMVWEFVCASNRPIFYSPRERANLKDSRAIPKNTFVWIGRYAESASTGAWASDYTKPYRMRATTLIYGYLVVQILTVRPDRTVKNGTVVHPNPGPWPWPYYTVQIWPSTKIAQWPPRLTVGTDVVLKDFWDRWNRHAPGELIPL